MKVVVGIGNPGREYQRTRHNVGFDVVDLLARSDGIEFDKRRFDARLGEGKIAGSDVLLVKPQTFVNNSGLAVRQVLDWWKLPVEDLLVVSDDANLPIGRIRFRREGSAGGHHGLESVAAHLGTDAFQRLRIGIGDAGREDLVGHVLGRFSRSERKQMDEACIDAARGITVWILHGIDECMSQFNG
jgi:peptidyl-tRNA hydrolase, PTH1 family